MLRPLFRFSMLWAVLALALAVWLSLGLAYQRGINSLALSGEFPGIHSDGWIRDGAELELPYLLKRGNRLRLSFNSWRPANAAPAHTKIEACGESFQVVVQASSVVELPLRSECSPLSLKFQVENPYIPSEKDDRRLIGQLKSIEVSSRLKLPVLSLNYFLPILGAALFSALLLHGALASFRLKGGFALALPIVAGLLYRANAFDLTKLYWLWLSSAALLAGVCVYGFLAGRLRSGAGSWSSAPMRSPETIWFFLALCAFFAGAALRFYGIRFGLPYNYHPDEVPKVNSIMTMYASGDLNPRYFLHPSLLLYCTYFTNTFLHFFGLVEGEFRTTAFLAGRGVSACAGSFSILALFFLVRRLYGVVPGTLAAWLLAVLPLHVTCSRYLKEDALLLFFTLCACLTVIKAVQEKRVAYLYLCAALVGLSASTKYTGFINIAILAAAPFLRSGSLVPDRTFLKHTFFAAFLAPLLFLLGSPYVLLNQDKFFSDFRYERKHMLRGHTHAIDAWSQYWMFHFTHSLLPGMTSVAALAALLAAGFLIRRGRSYDLFIIALILAFYLPSEWVKAKPAPQPERYILPCMPFFAAVLSEFCRTLWQVRWRTGSVLLALLCFGLMTKRSLELARDIPNDTREQVVAYFKENAPAGSKVWLDWQPYTPYLAPAGFDVDYILRENIIARLNRDFLVSSGRDYLILSTLFYHRYFDDTVADEAVRRRFIAVFNNLPVLREFSAPSGTNGFHNPVLTLFSLKADDLAKFDEARAKLPPNRPDLNPNFARTYFRWQR